MHLRRRPSPKFILAGTSAQRFQVGDDLPAPLLGEAGPRRYATKKVTVAKKPLQHAGSDLPRIRAVQIRGVPYPTLPCRHIARSAGVSFYRMVETTPGRRLTEPRGKSRLASEGDECLLEVKADLGGQRAWSDVVRAAEGREKVVEGGFVGDVDRRETQTPLVAVALEQIVVTNGEVEQVA